MQARSRSSAASQGWGSGVGSWGLRFPSKCGESTVMLSTDVLDALATLPLFEHVPPAELEWLCARGEVRHFPHGAIALEFESPMTEMWIVVEGLFALHVPRGGSW